MNIYIFFSSILCAFSIGQCVVYSSDPEPQCVRVLFEEFSDSSVSGEAELVYENCKLIEFLNDYPVSNKLDVFFFNSGNGNFAIATFGKFFSIFDAGGDINDPQRDIFPIIGKIIEKRQLTTVVLSHNHYDHINLLEHLYSYLLFEKSYKLNTNDVTLFTTTDISIDAFGTLYLFDVNSNCWNNNMADNDINIALNKSIFGNDGIGTSAFLLPTTPVVSNTNASSFVSSSLKCNWSDKEIE